MGHGDIGNMEFTHGSDVRPTDIDNDIKIQ